MGTDQEQLVASRQNTILVFEVDKGQVEHCFCTEAEAKDRMTKAVERGSAGSMFISDEKMSAEMLYSVSADLRSRVDEAKCQLRSAIALRDVLNRHGVPADKELRGKIKRAFDELQFSRLQAIFHA